MPIWPRTAPMSPAATRAAALQVGIRARERIGPSESPSHAAAQWHNDSPYSHLPLRGQRRTGPRGTPASRFTPRLSKFGELLNASTVCRRTPAWSTHDRELPPDALARAWPHFCAARNDRVRSSSAPAPGADTVRLRGFGRPAHSLVPRRTSMPPTRCRTAALLVHASHLFATGSATRTPLRKRKFGGIFCAETATHVTRTTAATGGICSPGST